MIKKLFRLVFKVFLWSIVISVLWVFVYKWIPVPVTPLMVIRYFEMNKKNESLKWEHQWIPIEEISKNMQLAVICSEDQRFLEHNGFDLKAIKKAINHNKTGKRIRGASTISQQTAKNVFLWPQRSWFRKGLETYFTFLIELIWSKERILEVYLNSIEMGDGIYGVEAASHFWFQKEAKVLDLYEAAAIAAILPNPRAYKAAPPTNYIESRKHWIVGQIRNFGPLRLEVKKEKANNHVGNKSN
ncbi:monofunctional biosynthetic peptidoglycan transglycosylase [Flavobacteriaceae bacterium M23B6Z8]